MKKSIFAFAFASLASFAIATSAAAVESVEKPILTISGNIDANDQTSVDFDRAMLEAMPKQVIETTTPWFDGKTTFEGVPLADLMEAVGAQGKTVSAIALNDYAVDIPVDDFETHGAILAYKRDGAEMEIRDKGPLFVIYPYDSDPQLQSQMFYSRSAWQVRRLVVKD